MRFFQTAITMLRPGISCLWAGLLLSICTAAQAAPTGFATPATAPTAATDILKLDWHVTVSGRR